MILGTIWERYFLKEILKTFFLFLFCFFFLYAVIDYSLHVQDFIKDKKIQFFDTISYYFYHFIKRANLLIPLALLIASIKVLTSFNASRELTALQVAGMKMTTLLRPFFLAASLCVLFNYVNLEFLTPKSLNYLDQFHDTHFRHSEKGRRKEDLHIIHLKDRSKLIYQSYDSSKKAFFDCLWIRSSDDIWRIKFLKPHADQPVGEYVDHLQRNDQGMIEKLASFDSYVFKGMRWESETDRKGFIPIENRSLSDLFRMLLKKHQASSYDRSQMISQFTFKSLIPLLSILVVMGSAPFCISYGRSSPIFFIYALSLFVFIAFFTLMNGSLILGANRVISPFWAIFIPFAGGLSICSWKFFKTIY